MRIRWKLLLLLLGMSIVPLVVVGVISLRLTRAWGGQLAGGARQQLVERAEEDLSRLVESQTAILNRDREIIELIVRRQAREVSLRLTGQTTGDGPIFFAEDYDDAARRPVSVTTLAKYHTVDAAGRRRPIPIALDAQVFKLAPGVEPGEVGDEIDALSSMVDVYASLRQSHPRLFLWQFTSTQRGVHSSYPGHGGYPAEYDPRRRQWYEAVREYRDVVWSPPYVDASLGRIVLTVAAPVYDDRQFIAATGVDYLLVDVLNEVQYPSRWQSASHTMIVGVADRADLSRGARPVIVARQEYHDQQVGWQDQLELAELQSPDAEPLAAMLADISAGRAGRRQMRYCDGQGDCRPSLWAYGPLEQRGQPAALVLVVPFDRIVADAAQAEQFVMSGMWQMTIAGTVAIGVMIALAAYIAWRGAHVVTRPVEALVEATDRVAGGDFNAHVEVKTGDEIQRLAEKFNAMVPRLHDQMKVRAALAVAMEVQQNLLPAGPPCIDGLDVCGMSDYCDETGGDYYDFVEISHGDKTMLAVVIGDVTGHGIAAALLMAAGRALWRSHIGSHGSLAETITRINRHLASDRLEGRFMTMMCMVINLADRTVRWVGAGHDEVLLYDPASDRFEELTGRDLPLGIEQNWEYHESSRAGLIAGQMLVVGTDGIWEARNPAGELFGKQRMREVIRRTAGRTAAEISRALIADLAHFRGRHEQLDDITLIVVKVTK